MVNLKTVIFPDKVALHSFIWHARKWNVNWKIHRASEASADGASPYCSEMACILSSVLLSGVSDTTSKILYCIQIICLSVYLNHYIAGSLGTENIFYSTLYPRYSGQISMWSISVTEGKEGGREQEGLRLFFFFFNTSNFFFNRNLSHLQHSLLFLTVQSELNMLVKLFWMTKGHSLEH